MTLNVNMLLGIKVIWWVGYIIAVIILHTWLPYTDTEIHIYWT